MTTAIAIAIIASSARRQLFRRKYVVVVFEFFMTSLFLLSECDSSDIKVLQLLCWL